MVKMHYPKTTKSKRPNVKPGKGLGASDLSSTSTQGMALASTSCTESGEVDNFRLENIVTLYVLSHQRPFFNKFFSTEFARSRTAALETTAFLHVLFIAPHYVI